MTQEQLIEAYEEYYKELIACDPSSSEDAMDAFFEIQQWGEELHTAARELNLTMDQVEDMANV